jgi:hypothetical protein
LYQYPIVSVAQVAEFLRVTPQAANSLVGELVRIGVLHEITGYERNRLFCYEAYVALFGDGDKDKGEVIDEK